MSTPEVSQARESMLRRDLVGRGIRDRRVLEAMAQIPRERFVAVDSPEQAYGDRALSIDCGQTISQPYIVALMSEALALQGHEHVLEIGTGSGYQTAILARLAGDVVSVERHPALAERAKQVLDELGCRNVDLVVGDGTRGWKPQAPYDRVIVTAAAEAFPPALVEQLREGGVLVIPLGGPTSQTLEKIEKHGDQLRRTPLTECRFVPLIGS